MINIIYLTTAQDSKSFANNLKYFEKAPNLSNQNFHNKLIRSLGLTNTVEVISSRPINTSKLKYYKNDTFKEGNVTWHYPKIANSKLDKFLFQESRFDSIIKQINSNDLIIFVDTLNLSLLKYALKIAKKKKIKVIGICTDNPNNISFTNKYYKTNILNLAKELDGYICMTNEINSLFNINNKPFLIIDGIVEETSISAPTIEGNYLYFGGSLMEEYGVFALINAFNSLKMPDLKLVISGHHEPENLKEIISQNKNIIYLGAVDYLQNISLEHYSLCCINPRPIDNKIDSYSFPSKVLEYMASGTLVISTMSPLIYKNYADVIIWAKSNSEEDLRNAIKKALSYSPSDRNLLIQNAKKAVLFRTSLNNINKLINELFL